jgi:protein-disulfide isomerase
LLAIQAQSNDEQVIKHALDDWYLSDKKEYDVFAAKYVMNGELTKQGEKIEAMDNWCKSMNIHVTPTVFINGYQLPMLITLRIYNIFCWNSSQAKKPRELSRSADRE